MSVLSGFWSIPVDAPDDISSVSSKIPPSFLFFATPHTGRKRPHERPRAIPEFRIIFYIDRFEIDQIIILRPKKLIRVTKNSCNQPPKMGYPRTRKLTRSKRFLEPDIQSLIADRHQIEIPHIMHQNVRYEVADWSVQNFWYTFSLTKMYYSFFMKALLQWFWNITAKFR